MQTALNSNTKLLDFELLEKLGDGSFSVVYKVKRKCDN